MRTNGDRALGSIFATLTWLPMVAGCATLPRQNFAGTRISDYLAGHPELSASVAEAMERGHVVLGMNERQVEVVLGDPARRSVFGAAPTVTVWLYPGHRLHQDPMRSHGVQLFRLVFIGGRLSLIEPL